MRGNVFVLVSLRSDFRFPRYSPRSKGTINFFLKYPELYVRARRTLGSLARASSRSTYRKLARHVRCSLHSRHFFSFLFLLFHYRAVRVTGGKKMWVTSTGAIHRGQYFSVSRDIGMKTRCVSKIEIAVLVNFYLVLYTNIFHQSLNETFFATRSLESVARSTLIY